MKTDAEKISAMFHDDGSIWMTPEGLPLWQACEEAGAEREISFPSETMAKYTFPDGSVIVAAEGGWDFGYRGCWCWRGVGHIDGCENRLEQR